MGEIPEWRMRMKSTWNLKLAVGIALSGLLCSGGLSAADFSDQLILENDAGYNSGRRIQDYDESLSKFDNTADQRNPYLGRLHRVFDSGFSPQRDHSLFVKRMREGLELYRERGVNQYGNKYNLFRTITDFLPGEGMSYDGGQPVVAMFTRSKQIFLIYRVYEARDGRSTLLCYYNSDGKIGHGGKGFAERLFVLKGYKVRKGYRITEGDPQARSLSIGLIDPSDMLQEEDDYDRSLSGKISRTKKDFS